MQKCYELKDSKHYHIWNLSQFSPESNFDITTVGPK
jgi:hypothetical protein